MAVSRLQTPVAAGNAAFGDTATASIDCTGADYLLAWVIWNDTATATISSITYNGVSMGSVLGSQTTNQRKQAVYGLASPTTGANNLVVTWSAGNPGANRHVVVGIPYSGVDISGTPVGTINSKRAASGTSITSDNVTTSDGDGLFSVCLETREAGAIDSITATGSGHSTVLGPTSNSGHQYAIGERAGSGTNVTMGFSWTGSEENGLMVVPLNASAGGGGTAVPVFVHNLRVQGIL